MAHPTRVCIAANQYGASLMPVELPFRLGEGFDNLYGLEVTHVSDELLRGRVEVTEAIKQPAGLVHGGVYAAVAESLASTGTALKVVPEGKMATGLSNLLMAHALIDGVILGGFVAVILLLTRIRGLKQAVPYGPFLALGTIATLFVQPP